MVGKDDWKTVKMPEKVEQFVMERNLTGEEIELIKAGYLPREMEDKWFMYYEDEKLYVHRSWTGYCIYIIGISQSGKMNVTVNRDPEQYKEEDTERDKIMVNILINRLLGRKFENSELMKAYINCGKKKNL